MGSSGRFPVSLQVSQNKKLLPNNWKALRGLGCWVEFFSLEGESGRRSRRVQVYPPAHGPPGLSAEGAIPQEIATWGPGNDPQGVRRQGKLSFHPPGKADGSPSSLLPPLSPPSQSLGCSSTHRGPAWSPSLLGPTFALPHMGDALSCPLGGH